MRYTTLLAIVAAGVHAAPQNINFQSLAPIQKPPQTVPADITGQVITYNPTAAASSFAAAVSNNPPQKKRGSGVEKRTTGDCRPLPASIFTGQTPADDPASFLAFVPFATAANTAPTPQGYTLAFKNLQASNNANQYMGFTQLTNYDTVACAQQCSAISGCSAINIYFERDPSLDPAPSCANPASVTNVKCVFWGGAVTTDNALNQGQSREQFQVVIAGSSGYNIQTVPTPDGYGPPTPLGTKSINAPLDCNAVDTFLGSRLITDLPFDITLCSAICDATSTYAVAHPPLTGPIRTCQFFNTYILYRNGIAQGQVCAMYIESWDSTYATNGGYANGNDIFTIGSSYIYSNAKKPNYAKDCVLGTGSSSTTASGAVSTTVSITASTTASTTASATASTTASTTPSTTASTIASTTPSTTLAKMTSKTAYTTPCTTTTTSKSSPSDPVCPDKRNVGINYSYIFNPTLNTGYGYPQFDVSRFSRVSPFFTGQTDRIGFSNTAPGLVSIYPGSPAHTIEQLAIMHTGYLYARTTGTYTFTLNAVDDIALSWVGQSCYNSNWNANNADLIAQYFGGPVTKTALAKQLTAGDLIPFRVLYANGVNTGQLGFTISAPDGTNLLCASSGARDVVTGSCSGSAPSFGALPVVAEKSGCQNGLTSSFYKNPYSAGYTNGNYGSFDASYFNQPSTQTYRPDMVFNSISFESSGRDDQWVVVVYKGWFAPTKAGWYSFTLDMDDLGQLYVGDSARNFTQSNFQTQSQYPNPSKSFSYYSPGGQYTPVTFVYGQYTGGAYLRFTISGPDWTTKNTAGFFKTGINC